MWIFRCYQNAQGKNLIISDITSLTVKGRMQAKRAMEHLSQKDIQHWARPHSSKISGHNHIYVIRFHDENRTQHRIFGHHDRAYTCFVMTSKAIEKDDKYIPANASDHASARMVECNSDFSKFTCNCLSGIPGLSSLSS